MENARLLWVHLQQRSSFSVELKILSSRRPLGRKNPLATLNPVLCRGLIRVGGRLSCASLDEESKHPYILSSRCTLATLLIKNTHFTTLHGGIQLTLCTLRRQYWLIHGRSAVKTLLHRCVTCLCYAASTKYQLMGELPKVRATPSLPFERSGVDYAGPTKVRLTKSRGKGTLKGYISIFICMCTRAVQIELVEDYSSEAFIAAFHRFTARRGHCKQLYSDQGTTFVGADSQLRDLISETFMEFKSVFNSLANLGTEWHFNPPFSPHF